MVCAPLRALPLVLKEPRSQACRMSAVGYKQLHSTRTLQGFINVPACSRQKGSTSICMAVRHFSRAGVAFSR